MDIVTIGKIAMDGRAISALTATHSSLRASRAWKTGPQLRFHHS